MKYLKIKVGYFLDSDRFYRTFLVDPNMNLKDFGCAILTSMFSTANDDYYFGVEYIRYLPKNLIREYYEAEDKLISEYTIKDLPDAFDFYYGMDEYIFYCEVLSIEEADDRDEIYLIDGAGQGIWEGNAHTLNSYLRGDLDPEGLEVDYFENIYPPTNVMIEKYGDFDTAFNLEAISSCFVQIYKLRLLQIASDEE